MPLTDFPGTEADFPADAVEVGRVVGAWGVKGWIKVQPFASDPQALFSTKRWYLRPAEGALTTGDAPDILRQAAENARAAFIEAMDSDFNSASALATLFELVKAIGAARSAGVSGPFYMAAQHTLRELAGVLGLTLAAPEEEKKAGSDSVAAKPFIDLLVSVRTDLRAAKQWALADKVRNELKALNVLLEDSPAGSTWRYEEQNGS